ncbi:hypothetical protein [Pseudomonas sp. RC3H12]|uniref:hypothetical protein n=1 Tax=Pseudomonas sp. RC3H12 TaxID=2834406 RepID=UPI001BDEF6E3|nr:hypothetical protein [Pseudomonas sp. RC3H12]QWA30725.1 hypothetical protein KHO27_07570 [Pseudomonas sp. RC3H12]
MARSARLQKKLHERHLIEVAEGVVLNDKLVEMLWALDHGEIFELNSGSFNAGAILRYRLNYVITRGPVAGHWLYRAFDPGELALFFTAKDVEGLGHGRTLFEDE